MAGSVVVTGAAGALGRAVVAEFSQRGDPVVALDVAGAALDAVAELASGAAVHPVAADLASRDAVAAAWKQVDELGPPRALVALAGGFAGAKLVDLDEATLEDMMQSNFVSALWCCQAAAQRITAAGGGAIVTVGSRTAVAGTGPVAHATSKAAVVRLTEVLAEDLKRSGVRVNTVLPSVIDTPANRSWMSADLAERAVEPEAIARVIAFLCSDDAWLISGARIPVYGQA
ncbi:MAG: SDR family NAD(P)-dependent oxidoreductase [Pseudonocardiaceae bacterium]|nr:SDR family NAD(P)-dependent oxidoreductase [Pseudonocardiaceae bacterium]